MKINEFGDWFDEEYHAVVQLRFDDNDDEVNDKDEKIDYQDINSNENLTTVNYLEE